MMQKKRPIHIFFETLGLEDNEKSEFDGYYRYFEAAANDGEAGTWDEHVCVEATIVL